MNFKYLLRGFAALSVGYALGKAIGFAAVVALSRHLPARTLGEYATIITFVGYLQAMTNWGSDALGIRTVARHPDQAGAQVREIARCRFAVGLAPVAIFMVGLVYFGTGLSTAAAVLAIWVAYLLRSDWALLAEGRNRSVGAWIIVREASGFRPPESWPPWVYPSYSCRDFP
jgi:O-antigen/teichoic acid export membrane protein